MSRSGIHIGVGGWTFEPWRGAFYPKGWPQARELEYAGRQLTAIEINDHGRAREGGVAQVGLW